MEKFSYSESSSPLSTIDEIHRRLVRPAAVFNHSRDRISSQFGGKVSSSSNSTPRNIETKTRLEDYLDLNLLSSIRESIGGKRERGEAKKLKKRERGEGEEFDWPVEKLKMLGEREMMMTCHLGDDDDDDVEGETEEGVGPGCSPFQRFERTALKRLRG